MTKISRKQISGRIVKRTVSIQCDLDNSILINAWRYIIGLSRYWDYEIRKACDHEFEDSLFQYVANLRDWERGESIVRIYKIS